MCPHRWPQSRRGAFSRIHPRFSHRCTCILSYPSPDRCPFRTALPIARPPVGAAKSIVDRSLRALLRDWRLKRAVSLWDALPSYSTGVQTFKASGSQTERAALWLIDRGA